MMHRQAFTGSVLVSASLIAACGAARSPALSTTPAAVPAAREAPPATYQAPLAPAPAAATPTGYADVNTDSSLISNGSVTASSPELLSTASAFRREVYRLGGRVFAEQVHFRAEPDDDGKQASAGSYRIKLLPRLLPDLLDWLGKHATITAQDVSSIVAMESEADAAIVRADVKQRLDEIEAQLGDPQLEPSVRAALEQEKTKLTGAAIPDPNAMADNTKRVAVLDVRLEAPRLPDPYAHGKLLGHARGSFLELAGIGRVGGGVGLGGHSPVSTVEVLGYSSSGMAEKAGVSVTLGFGGYSKAFGGGTRSSLNPYLGARVGYAYLDANYLEVAAEVGVELFKQRGVIWTMSARPMGLLGDTSKGAVEVGSSVGLAF